MIDFVLGMAIFIGCIVGNVCLLVYIYKCLLDIRLRRLVIKDYEKGRLADSEERFNRLVGVLADTGLGSAGTDDGICDGIGK